MFFFPEFGYIPHFEQPEKFNLKVTKIWEISKEYPGSKLSRSWMHNLEHAVIIPAAPKMEYPDPWEWE